MTPDIRDQAAKYYDLNPAFPDDIGFYQQHIASTDVSVLELGCGTGRVLLPLSEMCEFIHGIDLSEAMVGVCVRRLEEAHIAPTQAVAVVGDITDFDLGRTFDRIIAPFRVLQNLETSEQVDGLFACIRRHLAKDGRCILNVFNPNGDVDTLRSKWTSPAEHFAWERVIDGERITCHEKKERTHMDATNLVLYPELIYRTYSGEQLKDEAVLKIVMRCYYPEQFKQLIVDHGFAIVDSWGGYAGEHYGEGSELVVQFSHMRE